MVYAGDASDSRRRRSAAHSSGINSCRYLGIRRLGDGTGMFASALARALVPGLSANVTAATRHRRRGRRWLLSNDARHGKATWREQNSVRGLRKNIAGCRLPSGTSRAPSSCRSPPSVAAAAGSMCIYILAAITSAICLAPVLPAYLPYRRASPGILQYRKRRASAGV